MGNIKNKVVMITGASSGIGEATARMLVLNGAKVVLCARNQSKLEKMAEELGNDHVIYLASDVTNLDSLKKLVQMAKDKFGRIDVLFAGSNVSELKIDDWKAMVDVNINGVF